MKQYIFLALIFTFIGCSRGVVNTVEQPSSSTVFDVEIYPSVLYLPVGITHPYSATRINSDNSKVDITSQLQWALGNDELAKMEPCSNKAFLRSLNSGSTDVLGKIEAVDVTSELNITAANLVSLEISPLNLKIPVGSNKRFNALGYFDDYTLHLVSQAASWTSSDPSVIRLENDCEKSSEMVAVGTGTATISAQIGAVMGSIDIEVVSTNLSSISVSPNLNTLVKDSETQFSATAVYSNGLSQDVTNEVTWESSDEDVAQFTGEGPSILRTLSNGSSTISARLDNTAVDFQIDVTEPTLVTLDVSPANQKMTVGQKPLFKATGTFSDSTTQDLTSAVRWHSSNKKIMLISNVIGKEGQALCLRDGKSSIIASLGDVSAAIEVTVSDSELQSITLTPDSPTIPLVSNETFEAIGTYADGSTKDITEEVVWFSSDLSIGIISNDSSEKGLFLPVGVGSAQISARAGTIVGQTTATISGATLVSLSFNPLNPTIPLGTSLNVEVTGTFSDASTQNLTDSATWVSLNPTLFSVGNTVGLKGRIDALTAGSGTLSATFGGITANLNVSVSAALLQSIAITPPTINSPLGLNTQLTATGTFTDLSTLDITSQVTWSVDNPIIASVSNSDGLEGILLGLTLGSTSVTAELSGVSADKSIQVVAPVLTSIEITPNSLSIAAGLNQQFLATGHYSDGSTANITADVTWGTSNGALATISNVGGQEGKLLAVSIGAVDVTASLGAINSQVNISVLPAILVSIAVTPATVNVVTGLLQQFTATGTYSDGSTNNITDDVDWTSSNLIVAIISNVLGTKGLATCLALGTSNITATLGAVSGQTTITGVLF